MYYIISKIWLFITHIVPLLPFIIIIIKIAFIAHKYYICNEIASPHKPKACVWGWAVSVVDVQATSNKIFLDKA